MRICGVDVPVCGTVAMDQVIVDLTDVPSAGIGDEVEVISPEPSAPHSVESLAGLAGTIPYEITCGLGGRIRRAAGK
jgi:alanine racemase